MLYTVHFAFTNHLEADRHARGCSEHEERLVSADSKKQAIETVKEFYAQIPAFQDLPVCTLSVDEGDTRERKYPNEAVLAATVTA